MLGLWVPASFSVPVCPPSSVHPREQVWRPPGQGRPPSGEPRGLQTQAASLGLHTAFGEAAERDLETLVSSDPGAGVCPGRHLCTQVPGPCSSFQVDV